MVSFPYLTIYRTLLCINKISTWKRKRAGRDLNTQPSDMESHVLLLRHQPDIQDSDKPFSWRMSGDWYILLIKCSNFKTGRLRARFLGAYLNSGSSGYFSWNGFCLNTLFDYFFHRFFSKNVWIWSNMLNWLFIHLIHIKRLKSHVSSKHASLNKSLYERGTQRFSFFAYSKFSFSPLPNLDHTAQPWNYCFIMILSIIFPDSNKHKSEGQSKDFCQFWR